MNNWVIFPLHLQLQQQISQTFISIACFKKRQTTLRYL